MFHEFMFSVPILVRDKQFAAIKKVVHKTIATIATILQCFLVDEKMISRIKSCSAYVIQDKKVVTSSVRKWSLQLEFSFFLSTGYINNFVLYC